MIDIDNGGQRLDAETDIIELKDGTLYAAQRPAMCFSVSADRGRTWSVSKPMGFEGHCPYLLRTADDIILLAHRLPATSLHYSLDECKTWSQNVPVDNVIGAYPSMVNLKDGSRADRLLRRGRRFEHPRQAVSRHGRGRRVDRSRE